MNPSQHRNSTSSSIHLPYTAASTFPTQITNTTFHPQGFSPHSSLRYQDNHSGTSYPSIGISNSTSAPYPTRFTYDLQTHPSGAQHPYNGRNAEAHRHSSESSHSPYPVPLNHLSNPLSASSSSSIVERNLRSPHPPLTASIHPSYPLWPPPLHPIEQKDPLGRPSYTHPFASGPSGVGPSQYRSRRPSSLHGQSTQVPTHPSAPPPFLTHPSTVRTSPFQIPPPLRFNYSGSPPTGDMPPRKKAAIAGGSSGKVTPLTPQTMSSSSSRHKITAKGNGWTMEQTYDSIGQKKEVIVINDSESPSRLPRKRTRAQAATEAAMVNGHSANGSSSMAGSAKKRKADEVSDAGSVKKAKPKPSGVSPRHQDYC